MICIVFDAAATIIAVDDDVWGGVHISQINQLHALAFLINDFWTFGTSILEHNYRRLDSHSGPENLKKVQAKKLVKSNISISQINFLAKFHFFAISKMAKNQFLKWGKNLKVPKMREFFFFCLDFLKFSGPLWLHPWSISSFKLPRRYLSKVI